MQIIQIITGITFGILISAIAWRLGSLSNSGAISAAITGSLIFGIGGFAWGALLLAFFISSSGLSKTFRKRKTGLSEKFSKGSQRDWGQVIRQRRNGNLHHNHIRHSPRGILALVCFRGCHGSCQRRYLGYRVGGTEPHPPKDDNE